MATVIDRILSTAASRRTCALVLTLAAGGALAGGLSAQQRPAPAGIAVAAVPAIVTLGAGAEGQAASVELRNEGAAPAQLRIYLGDFEQDQEGGFDFLRFGQGSHSCGARLTAFPDGAVLAPGERQQVQLRLAGGGVCWGVLFVESMPQGRGPVKTIQRIGIKVLNVPAGTPAAGEVASVEVGRSAGDSVRVRALFQNTGESPLELKGRVEVRDYTGKVFAETAFGPFGSLPGRARMLDVAVPARLAPGEYVVVPIVDFGGAYLAGGQALLKVQ